LGQALSAASRNINELLRYKFHKENNLPEHHALYDFLCESCIDQSLETRESLYLPRPFQKLMTS
jgi:hypothetical protein